MVSKLLKSKLSAGSNRGIDHVENVAVNSQGFNPGVPVADTNRTADNLHARDPVEVVRQVARFLVGKKHFQRVTLILERHRAEKPARVHNGAISDNCG